MIVVGIVSPSAPNEPTVLAIARRAATSGARAEVVGAVPVGAAGDRLLIELAAVGVGHATVQRTSAAPEAADLELALRYLPDIHVVVLAGAAAPLLPTAATAAAWSGASLVLVEDGPVLEGLAVEPLVLAPPAHDPDETFAGFVAALAVRLDAGGDARTAWDETIATLGADRVGAPDRPADSTGTATR